MLRATLASRSVACHLLCVALPAICLFAYLRTRPFGTGGTFQVRVLEGRGGIWHVGVRVCGRFCVQSTEKESARSWLGTCAIGFVPLLLEELPIANSRGSLVWAFWVSQIGEDGSSLSEMNAHVIPQWIPTGVISKDFCQDFPSFSPYGSGENV